MAVHIRLARQGSKKKPFYRVVVTDQRSPRGGRFLENIGTYDPSKDPGQLVVDQERLTFWSTRGALASDTLARLIKRDARKAAALAPPAEPSKPAAAAPAKKQPEKKEKDAKKKDAPAGKGSKK
jgi:small subunit ribosomal protein S16